MKQEIHSNGKEARKILQGQFELLFQDNPAYYLRPFSYRNDGRWTAEIDHSGFAFDIELPDPNLDLDILENWGDTIAFEEELASYARNVGLLTRPLYWAAPIVLKSQETELPFSMLVKTRDMTSPIFSIRPNSKNNITKVLGIKKLDDTALYEALRDFIPFEIANIVKSGFRPRESLFKEFFNLTVIDNHFHIFLDNFEYATMQPHFGYETSKRDISATFSAERETIQHEISTYIDFAIHIICMNLDPNDYQENFRLMQRAIQRDGSRSYTSQIVELLKSKSESIIFHERKIK